MRDRGDDVLLVRHAGNPILRAADRPYPATASISGLLHWLEAQIAMQA